MIFVLTKEFVVNFGGESTEDSIPSTPACCQAPWAPLPRRGSVETLRTQPPSATSGHDHDPPPTDDLIAETIRRGDELLDLTRAVALVIVERVERLLRDRPDPEQPGPGA
jgi:hypothetical protein